MLHLLQGLEIGGLEMMVVNLLARLDCSYYQLAVCCYDSQGSLVSRLSDKGIAVHLLRRRAGVDFAYILKLANFFRKSGVQILHLHNPTAFFYGTLAGRLARVPCIVYTEHGRDFSASRKVKIINRMLARMVDRIIAVSVAGKEYLAKEEGIARDRIQLIYNGVEDTQRLTTRSQEAIRRELGLTSKRPVIGIVARLDWIKNHASLLRAMQIISRNYPDAILLVVGDGPLKADLQILAEQLRIQDKTYFLGARTDIPDLLSVMDVFVLCSHNEGLSLTLIEACAAGKPIVATDVGGNREVVKHQINGLLVPANESQSLAMAIQKILGDKDAAREMGRKGCTVFAEQFTIDTMVDTYQKLYNACLQQKQRNFEKNFSIY